jgi:hypothetical protein
MSSEKVEFSVIVDRRGDLRARRARAPILPWDARPPETEPWRYEATRSATFDCGEGEGVRDGYGSAQRDLLADFSD